MQLEQTAAYLHEEPYPIVLDMRSRKGGSIIRQVSVNSFNRVSDAFTSAINQCIASERKDGADIDLTAEYATYIKAKKESLDVFRTKGKEIQCIIPSNGPFERFSLSCVRLYSTKILSTSDTNFSFSAAVRFRCW
jgi:hypothetical protein